MMARKSNQRWQPNVAVADLHRRQFMQVSMAVGASALIPDGLRSRAFAGASPSPDAPRDLISAITDGDLSGVKRILGARPELRMARDAAGRSMFVLAHLHQRPKIAAEILRRGINLDMVEAVLAEDEKRFIELAKINPKRVNADHPIGGTAYYAAALFGKVGMMWPLNRWGGDPNANPRGTAGVTALRAALNCTDKDAAMKATYRILTDAGDPNALQKDNDTVLHGAAELGDPDLVRAIIRRGGNVTVRNAAGETPLDLSIRGGHQAATKVLRNHESIPRMHRSSRFAYDASGGNYTTHADLNIPQFTINHFGEVCHYNLGDAKAIYKKHPDVIHAQATWDELGVEACAHMAQPTWTKYFLERGAPMALATALAVKDTASARRMLAEDRARINERGPHDFALMWYPQIAGGQVGLAELLLEFGADVNEHKFGTTCLHKAAHYGQKDLVAFLLEHGANVNTVGQSDFSALRGTPLDWALAGNRVKVAAILRDHGAKRHNG